MLIHTAMSHHVLIAEDEPSTQRSLAFILAGHGFRISCADNGLEALKKLRDFRSSGEGVDLLLLDIRMPEMSGIELLDELDREGSPVPTIVMTGFGDRNTLMSLVDRGCLGYLDKPFEPDQVMASVNKALDRQNRRARSLSHEMIRLKAQKDELERAVQKCQQTHLSHVPGAVSISPSPADFPARVAGFPGMDRAEACPRTVLLQQTTPRGGTVLLASYKDSPAQDVTGAAMSMSLFSRNTAWNYNGADFLRLLSSTGASYQPCCRLHSGAFIRFDASSRSVQVHVTSGMTVAWIPSNGHKTRLYISPPSETPDAESPVIEAMTFLAEPGDRIVTASCEEEDFARFSQYMELPSQVVTEGFSTLLEQHRTLPLEEMGCIVGGLFAAEFPRIIPLVMTEVRWDQNQRATGGTSYVFGQ